MIDQMDWIELIDYYDNPVRGATAVIQQKPDILISDYAMPYMNGTDLIDWIMPQISHMENPPKLIILSANEASDCENISMADGFICKKDMVDPEKFEMKLSQIVGLQTI